MTIRQTKDVVNGVEDRMWAAECPCQPAPAMKMRFRCIRSDVTFAWAARHIDRYHPKGAQ